MKYWLTLFFLLIYEYSYSQIEYERALSYIYNSPELINAICESNKNSKRCRQELKNGESFLNVSPFIYHLDFFSFEEEIDSFNNLNSTWSNDTVIEYSTYIYMPKDHSSIYTIFFSPLHNNYLRADIRYSNEAKWLYRYDNIFGSTLRILFKLRNNQIKSVKYIRTYGY